MDEPARHALTLYDSKSRSKRVFVPLDEKNVRMYVCGPTVYDHPHIGNARPVVVFDALFRLLRFLYGEDAVCYIRNITDIDDKIINAAKEKNLTIAQLTQMVEEQFHLETRELLCLEVSASPRATEYIKEMQEIIRTLLEKGAAYEAEGHVLFDVSRFAGYGALSGRKLEDMIAGARVEVAPYKRNAHDFVLWKPSAAGETGWDGAWGRGRPGWHLECSAMSGHFLGETFDIHGGGQDLLFPHHENERAQSCAAGGQEEMARFWVHNGYVVYGGEKMSKSVGNVLLTAELLRRFRGETIRLALLSGHYRQPLNITARKLEESQTQLDRFYGAKERISQETTLETTGEATNGEPDGEFLDALLDDLNTPRAIARLHALADAVYRGDGTKEAKEAGASLLTGAGLLGLLQGDAAGWLGYGNSDDAAEALLARREEARQSRDFGEADRIRDLLGERGYRIEDTPKGPRLRRLSHG